MQIHFYSEYFLLLCAAKPMQDIKINKKVFKISYVIIKQCKEEKNSAIFKT